MTLDRVSFGRAPGQVTTDRDIPVVQTGGYTAHRVKIDQVPEGFRIGGRSSGGCGTTTIVDSFARVVPPDVCTDWHGDAIQGYDGPPLIVRNSVAVLDEGDGHCGGGTAPFFVPHSQGNTSVDVDGLLVLGGGYSFRNGVPGSVAGLAIASGGWFYGPVDVRCSVLSGWQANIVTIDAAFQQTSVVRAQACTGGGG